LTEGKKVDINIPKDVDTVIRILEENGFEAYAVGGCIRDSVLKKSPKDWDITTSAEPEEIKSLFKRTVDTGIKHGTVTVLIAGVGYEVTTYRIDGEYKNGRHPDEVFFTSDIIEDLRRRDFTINAMAYNKKNGLLDCFDGETDIEKRIIRCVGNATERFEEDALRILRAIRFAGVLDFEIEESTKEAIIKLSPTLVKISRERIQAELDKLIISDNPSKIRLLYELDVIRWLFLDYYKSDKIEEDYQRMIKLIEKAPKDHYIRWALFISFSGVPNLLRSLKFDNITVNICNKLKTYKDYPLKNDIYEIKKLIVLMGEEVFSKYYLTYRQIMDENIHDLIEEIKKTYALIKEENHCISIKDLKIGGNDLKKLGVEQGTEIGRIINHIFEMVLKDNTLNNEEKLIGIARELM